MVTRAGFWLLLLLGAPAWADPAAATALSPAAQAPAPASGTARALSPSADVLAPLPPRPRPPAKLDGPAWERFTGVTILSMPFTAFWCVLGAVAINAAAGHSYDTPMLQTAGTVAVGASLAIGVVSLSWGASPADSPPPADPLSPTAKP